MSKGMFNIKEMLSDVNGNLSTNRFISLFVSIFPLIVWGVISIRTTSIAPISEEMLYLICAGLTSKVVQRKIEEDGRGDCIGKGVQE